MLQLNSVADPSLFRTARLAELPSKVDRKANIIFGANLMQVGDLNDGDSRPWTIDGETLRQAQRFMSQGKNGAKARFTHPNMSSDGMGSYLGRWKNVRVDGGTLRGDLHIADAAFTSPQGDLGTYVMDLAESDPEAFGVSLATMLDRENLDKHDEKLGKWPMRFSDVRAGDIVDEPAATRGGMFDLTTPDLRNLPAQATALLSTYFGDASEQVVRGRIDSFLSRYFSTKKDEPMAEETQVSEETPESQQAVETPAPVAVEPVADLSAAGSDGVTTTVTTDFAAAERDRCKKIRALCELAGVPDKFNTFVDNNFSVEETQAALRDIVSKKNPSLSQVPEQTQKDPDADLKAEYAECVKFKVTMGLSESEYIANARRKTA
jgi:hypothetical protein